MWWQWLFVVCVVSWCLINQFLDRRLLRKSEELITAQRAYIAGLETRIEALMEICQRIAIEENRDF